MDAFAPPPRRSAAMSRIAGELASADRALRDALTRLRAARKRFEQGSARALGTLLERKAELQRKLVDTQQVMDTLQGYFVSATHATGRLPPGTRMKDVQAFQRSEEETDRILRSALAQVNSDIAHQKRAAGNAHRDYLAAYDAAYTALARQRAWQALVAHGEPIAQAIGLLACVPLASDAVAAAGGAAQISRANFVWHELTRLAADTPAGAIDPGVELVLGTLDTAPFDAPSELLAGHAQMRRREAAAS